MASGSKSRSEMGRLAGGVPATDSPRARRGAPPCPPLSYALNASPLLLPLVNELEYIAASL